MAKKISISNLSDQLVRGFQSIDGTIINRELQESTLRLAKDDKGAMVNDIVDKYLRKELTNEYLAKVKAEHGITSANIARELAKRQIQKVMGI